MRLDRIVKVTYDKPFKNKEHFEIVKQRVQDLIGDEYTVIVCDDGMDISAMVHTYYGIRNKQGEWIMRDSGIVWFPCYEAAEISMNSYIDADKVEPINDIEHAKAQIKNT